MAEIADPEHRMTADLNLPSHVFSGSASQPMVKAHSRRNPG